MKGRFKFWLGVLIILITIIIYNVNYKFTNSIWLAISEIILVIILLIILLLQVLSFVIFIDPTIELYDNKNIYDAEPENIPATWIGYIQIPVMIVKFIKIINRWADQKL